LTACSKFRAEDGFRCTSSSPPSKAINETLKLGWDIQHQGINVADAADSQAGDITTAWTARFSLLKKTWYLNTLVSFGKDARLALNTKMADLLEATDVPAR
jgi:hypothetical protein